MQDNPIPENLRSDHLFLLIGTNPLPNWVAARLLLRDGGRLYLVHSPETKPHAERLMVSLGLNEGHVERVPIAEADEQGIYTKVSGQLAKLKGSAVGLHYTGGTKMMSVHAHRAMRESGLQPVPVLSYLDARTLRMKFDGRDPEGFRVALAPRVGITLDTLLRLHEDYSSGTIPEYEPKCEAAAKALADVHSNYSGQRAWRDWCDEALKSLDNKKIDTDATVYRRTVQQLDQLILPTDSKFRSYMSRPDSMILNYYSSFLRLIDPVGGTTLQTLARHYKFKDSLHIARWLHGLWLEHHTLAQIKTCANKAHLTPDGVGMNLNPKNQEEREFEADVLVLRGYQLFYFSCYSGSDYKTAKLKLFEAIIRATQLGGDEALIALVSCVDNNKIGDFKNVDDLRREVEANWQVTGRIQVFGRQDLSRLAGKLENWFNHHGYMVRR